MDLTRQVIASPSREIPLWTVLAPLIGGVIALGEAVGVGGYSAIWGCRDWPWGIRGYPSRGDSCPAHWRAVRHSVVGIIGDALRTISRWLGDAFRATEDASLARDTVFATVMILLNGIVGSFAPGWGSRHRAQEFSHGQSAALVALATITVMTLVFPTLLTVPGPFYSPSQLALWPLLPRWSTGAFILTQTIGYRPLFLENEPSVAPRPQFSRQARSSRMRAPACSYASWSSRLVLMPWPP